MKTPEISVGIISGDNLKFTLNGEFKVNETIQSHRGTWTAVPAGSGVAVTDSDGNRTESDRIAFEPHVNAECSFTLHAVTIGVNFHWQRDEDQTFRGKLMFINEQGRVTAVNILSIEDYLMSVISSEMSATSSSELLKAHAVISRSWLLAQKEKTARLGKGGEKYRTIFKTDDELVKWYDREDHANFDVCADDHCQRYQGITRASARAVEEAIKATSGEVLMYGDGICDARYSKCCGGITELFENAWEPVNHPYLVKLVDGDREPEGYSDDLTVEANAVRWIDGNPGAFCNTNDRHTLTQVLNSYDQETNDFYRWKVIYTRDELSALIKERSGIDFGLITDLEPLTRGTSGRIVRLRITGEKKTLIVGKELEIRKYLSRSHLYSSAFRVEKVQEGDSLKFILHGAGWGHGVGLCQIGAAVMGAQGYSYRQILSHYFRNASLKRLY